MKYSQIPVYRWDFLFLFAKTYKTQ